MGLEKQSIYGVEPTFGERAQAEWEKARNEWVDFGKYPFPQHNKEEVKIYLDDYTTARYDRVFNVSFPY